MTVPVTPTDLFVVACPACGGYAAAARALAGGPASCPRCAAAFLVPRPPVAAHTVPGAATAAQSLPDGPAACESSSHQLRPLHADAAAEPPATRPVSADEPPPTFEVPDHVLQPNDPAAELEFRTPVKTIGDGPDAIVLRQLSPAEREARRRRRNIVMLVAGGAILTAIVMRFSGGRRR